MREKGLKLMSKLPHPPQYGRGNVMVYGCSVIHGMYGERHSSLATKKA